MERSADQTSRTGIGIWASQDTRLALPSLASFGRWSGQAGLPFLVVAYLGFRGGGYDEIVRSELGFSLWWILLIGVSVGILPVAGLRKAAWLTLGVATAFAAWTGLGIAWSESAERSVAELGRMATLMGIFSLALVVQGRGGLRRTLYGVSLGIVLVSSIALLSRFQPDWFPALEAPQFLPETQARLHYPLNYWNGLATFAAIGIPLLLVFATQARHVAAQSLALAAVPLLALTAFFTLSRGGLVEVAVALGILLLLHPSRLRLVGPIVVAGTGSAILIAAASQRDPLVDGLTTQAALSSGDEMLAMTLVVSTGVGLIAAALATAHKYGVGPRVSISRRQASLAALAATVAVIGVSTAVGAPDFASQTWSDFKDSPVDATGAERFESVSGNGRYQYWQAAVEAGKTEPLTGIGPGTFEFFWAQEGTGGFVRDAHSLYVETFAELGVVGLLLILALVALPFVIGTKRLFSIDPERRVLMAGALAACGAFAASASFDWSWELTVLPAIFLLLTAAVVQGADAPSRPTAGDRRIYASRLGLSALAVAGGIAVAIPLLGAKAVDTSQQQVQVQNLQRALEEARTAAVIEPYAASPSLQQALVLEIQGDAPGAARAARAAADNEPTNWRTWLVLSRLEAKAGNARASVTAFRRARSLNPRSPIFQ